METKNKQLKKELKRQRDDALAKVEQLEQLLSSTTKLALTYSKVFAFHHRKWSSLCQTLLGFVSLNGETDFSSHKGIGSTSFWILTASPPFLMNML